MKIFDSLIRIHYLEVYCFANLFKHNFRFYNNQLERTAYSLRIDTVEMSILLATIHKV